MTIYGDTALAVVSAYDNINKPDPRECWENSITYFTESKETQKKGCPKSAFLGLCEDGYVDGIPKGSYLFYESPNKLYATTAAELLLAEPNKKYSKSGLWKKATEHCDSAAKNENGQMDVVLALKQTGLLKRPN